MFRRTTSSRALGLGAGVIVLASVGVYQMSAVAAPAPQVSMARAEQQFLVAAQVTDMSVTRDGYEGDILNAIQWPVNPATFTQGYGPRPGGGFHSGDDFFAGNGTPIHVIADGTVVDVGSDASLGTRVSVQHIIDGRVVYSVYGHMQAGSATVAVGQKVMRGDVLGLIGMTGSATAPHLHLAIGSAPIGGFIDPMPWLRAHVNVAWGS